MEKVNCIVMMKVKFNLHEWQHIFRVKPPIGKIKTLYCDDKLNIFSSELNELIQKYEIGDDYPWNEWYPETIPYKLMEEIKKFAE